MFRVTPIVFFVLGVLLLRWGYVVLDRGALAGRGAVRLALVGLPGLYLATWVHGLMIGPGNQDMLVFEAAYLTLLFWTWVSAITLVSLVCERVLQALRGPMAGSQRGRA